MIKKSLTLLFSIILYSEGQTHIIDAIAIDVNGEPITILDIKAAQKKFNLSQEVATKELITNRLELSAIKEANIKVSPDEVNREIEQSLQKRGITKEEMISILQRKGLTWETYKKQFELNMKKRILFQRNMASLITPPTDDELRMYYEANKEKFANVDKGVTKVHLIMYVSNSIRKLRQAIQNPIRRVAGVRQQNISTNSVEMNPRLFALIQNTPEGTFTEPINTGRGFVSYYVQSKSSQQTGEFEMVKNLVLMRWKQEEMIKARENFYNKLKSNARIIKIRSGL